MNNQMIHGADCLTHLNMILEERPPSILLRGQYTFCIIAAMSTKKN